MNVREWGIALLCCVLPGDALTPLTLSQLRTLGLRVRAAGLPEQPGRKLDEADVRALGYSGEQAERVCALLNREARLEQYLSCAREQGIILLTRLSTAYPARLRQQLGLNAPPVLFAAGDSALLERSAVSVVGSRQLREPGRRFADNIGAIAAREGYVLVSGNAAGADRTAQSACLRNGGSIAAFLADELSRHIPRDGKRQLMLSEGGYHLEFSAARALRRNQFIHAMGEVTFVAQSDHGVGGTWSGTVENLRHGWSEVYVCDDGSAAMRALCERGATALSAIPPLRQLQPDQCSFLPRS